MTEVEVLVEGSGRVSLAKVREDVDSLTFDIRSQTVTHRVHIRLPFGHTAGQLLLLSARGPDPPATGMGRGRAKNAKARRKTPGPGASSKRREDEEDEDYEEDDETPTAAFPTPPSPTPPASPEAKHAKPGNVGLTGALEGAAGTNLVGRFLANVDLAQFLPDAQAPEVVALPVGEAVPKTPVAEAGPKTPVAETTTAFIQRSRSELLAARPAGAPSPDDFPMEPAAGQPMWAEWVPDKDKDARYKAILKSRRQEGADNAAGAGRMDWQARPGPLPPRAAAGRDQPGAEERSGPSQPLAATPGDLPGGQAKSAPVHPPMGEVPGPVEERAATGTEGAKGHGTTALPPNSAAFASSALSRGLDRPATARPNNNKYGLGRGRSFTTK